RRPHRRRSPRRRSLPAQARQDAAGAPQTIHRQAPAHRRRLRRRIMPLSCCIIAKNEGDRIEACIKAASRIADEIVVVDSGSTDDTVAKAKALGAKVYFRAWDGFGPQKRFAEECASNDWILNLDADEVVTPELAGEIAEVMRTPARLPAY